MKHKPFGLTGNMGCGKSTVGRFLLAFPDVTVFNTDEMAKEVIRAPEYQHAITKIFGSDVLVGDTIRLPRIAQIIFQDSVKRRQLERFLYTHVVGKLTQQLEEFPETTIVIVESALIYESATESQYSSIIVATCESQEQVRRLCEFRGKTVEDVKTRLALQLPSEEKVRRADFVIDTHCGLEELEERTHQLYHQLRKYHEGGRS